MWTKHLTDGPRARPVIGLTLALVLVADGTAVALRADDRTSPVPRPSPAAVRADSPAGRTNVAPDASEGTSPVTTATASALASATPPAGPSSPPVGGRASQAVGAPASSPPLGVADPTYRAPGGDVVRGPVPPPVGVYGLTASGSATAAVGSRRCGGAPQPSATSTVGATAAGAEPSFALTDTVALPGGPLRLTLGERYTDTLTLTDARRIDLSCGAAGHISVRLAPALLAFPLNLATGEHWTGHSRSAGTDVTSMSHVTGIERVRIGNATYGTYVVETTQTWTGAVHGTVRERWWVSPQLGVPLRMTLDDDLAGPRLAWGAALTLQVTSVPVKKATAEP